MINAQGTSPEQIWARMASIFGQALKAIRDDPSATTAPPASLAEYEGLYESDWGETFVLRWDGSLAAVSLPTSDPIEALQKLRRDDGGPSGHSACPPLEGESDWDSAARLCYSSPSSSRFSMATFSRGSNQLEKRVLGEGSRRYRWALPVLSVASVLLVLELALIPFPVIDPLPFMPDDEEYPFLRFQPEQEYTWSRGWNFEVVNQVRVNNYGFVSDHDYDAEATTPLLAVVGDSYVEAAMVPYGQTCAGRLATHLSPRLRVYSVGFSGAPLSQYLVYAQYLRDEFRPSGVVFIVVQNDFLGSLLKYSRYPQHTYFDDGNAGELTFVRLFRSRSWLRRSMSRSNLLRYMYWNVGLAYWPADWRRSIRQRAVTGSNPNAAEWLADSKRAIDHFFELLPEMSGLEPARIAFVVDGPRFTLYSESEEAAERFQGSLADMNRRYFMAGAEARGYEIMDMLPRFADHWKANGARFDWPKDSHWNALGHSVCFETVAKSGLLSGM